MNLCSCVSAACGGFIELNANDPPGYIRSPNYPQNYPQNIDCVWVVTVPNGESVRLDFEEEFYIEPSSRYGSARVPPSASSLLTIRTGCKLVRSSCSEGTGTAGGL